jgi:hypothetical protein
VPSVPTSAGRLAADFFSGTNRDGLGMRRRS